MDTEGLKQKVRVLEEENKLLQQRLEFLEDAFDHLPQQLWILSESGELLYTSQSMREVLGSLGCGEGMNIYTWLSKSPYRATEQMVKKNDEIARQSTTPLIFEETTVTEKKGKRKKCTYLSYKQSFSSEHYPGRLIVGMSFDITERKEAEARLLENVNELKLAAKTKRTFVQNFRHDLKEPLSNIIGASDCLLNMSLPKDTEVWVESISQSAKRLLEYINKLTSGLTKNKEPLPIKIAAVDLKHEVAVLEKSFRTIAKARKLNLDITFSEDFPKAINLDVIRMQRIISNLVSNALKYTNEGGVTVTILYTQMEGSSLLEICVEDTGVGIPQAFQEFVFSPFSRIVNHSGSDGSGLGLAIVKDFVDDLQGQVSVKSIEGKGSTFVVMLPVINNQTA